MIGTGYNDNTRSGRMDAPCRGRAGLIDATEIPQGSGLAQISRRYALRRMPSEAQARPTIWADPV
jgi:hypothetical protein